MVVGCCTGGIALLGLGTLAFVSQAFLLYSSRQQRLSRKNFDVAKELESYREEGISEHLLFFFPPPSFW